jgi:hypothetical protein
MNFVKVDGKNNIYKIENFLHVKINEIVIYCDKVVIYHDNVVQIFNNDNSIFVQSGLNGVTKVSNNKGTHYAFEFHNGIDMQIVLYNDMHDHFRNTYLYGDIVYLNNHSTKGITQNGKTISDLAYIIGVINNPDDCKQSVEELLRDLAYSVHNVQSKNTVTNHVYHLKRKGSKDIFATWNDISDYNELISIRDLITIK